jgi:EmrB/QacA subfamily drug resistance transporter
VNVALKAIGSEFSMSAVLLGWVSTIFLLTAAVLLIPVGKLADIIGRKKIFSWGVGIFTLASVFSAISPNANFFIAFRGLHGIGSAFIYATSVAILTSVFPQGKRGQVLGIITGTIYLGLALGPTLGGVLISLWGWRSIFWVNVPLGLAVLFLTSWKLEGEWAEAAGERFDWAGSAIYGISLGAFLLGFPRLPAPLGIGLTSVGIAGVLMFLRWELRTSNPVLNFDLFRRNPSFTFSNFAELIYYNATNASGFLICLYLLHIRGLSPQKAGLILVSHPVVIAVLSPIAGRLADRIEVRKLTTLGMTLTTLALFTFIFLEEQTTFWTIILSLIMLGCGFALFSSPNTNVVMNVVERKSYSVASSILNTMRLLGRTLSLGIATLVFALYLGQVAITPEVHNQFLASLKTVFAVFTGLAFLGVLASLARVFFRRLE